MAEARMAAFRQVNNGNWRSLQHNGHTRITEVVTDPKLVMRSDMMRKRLSEAHRHETILDWDRWKNFDSRIATGKLIWYTDGSKTNAGTGAGVYAESPSFSLSVPLGRCATVFQAEVSAIQACVRENLRRRYINKWICILSDSQAALKALSSDSVDSKLVWDCLEDLDKLAKHNKLSLVWVPGHKGIDGNEKADNLAKKGAISPFIGPEPAFGISKTTVRHAVSSWVNSQQTRNWQNSPGLRQSKKFLRAPDPKLTSDILALNRTDIRKTVGLLTGHCNLRKHLHTMGIFTEEPICRLCNEDEETSSHVIFECEALTQRRFRVFQDINPGEEIPTKNLVKRLLDLVKGLDLFDRE